MRKVIYGVVCTIAAICAVLGGNKMDTNECNLNAYSRQKNAVVLHEVQEYHFVCSNLANLYDENGFENTIMIDWTHDVAG
ncbi:MAG: hypothetical protein MR504_08375 [Methanobrevibacter woesei]|uniref:hypothetical protein n=1 Tax=Methanobrevibacter woesei TaxID=190976 RepID=UPI0023F03857|nr:hypothetical protein [Methanobrevibacter woesei]MCI7292193.1 hypothetical protein [Methanobrevibacter woesei]